MDTASASGTTCPRYPELAGRVAVVTGSSRRIGRGIAERLARENMKVVINGRTPETVIATAAELRALGAEVLPVPADVGRTADVDRLFAETLRAFGTVDLLVNNAADLRRTRFFDVDEGFLDHQINDNIKGPYMCACRAADVMRKSGGGSIINISSVGGRRAHWNGLPYDVAKGAIDAMTRAMALELADYGIRVNAVAPGPIREDATAVGSSLPELERVPLRRFGHPADIGAAVAFLASPDAAFITGQILYVDGGLMAQLTPRNQPI